MINTKPKVKARLDRAFFITMKYTPKKSAAEKRLETLDVIEHQIKQIDKDIAYFNKVGTPEIRTENVKRLNAEKAKLLDEVRKIANQIKK